MATDSEFVEVKSKFEQEYRRFSFNRTELPNFEKFYALVRGLHRLQDTDVTTSYTEPVHGDLLPINNDDNFQKAITTAKPLLRIFVYRGQDALHADMFQQMRRRRAPGTAPNKKLGTISISTPQDFRKVSAIVDADLLPETVRRVKLLKHSSNKPLGFYIRDGVSTRVTPEGILDKVPGIFISRLVPGGLAEGTGLLAVDDEILEVNGIEVTGKSLDQVTDMMVANSQNLIITVKPGKQPQKAETVTPGTGGTLPAGTHSPTTRRSVAGTPGATSSRASVATTNSMDRRTAWGEHDDSASQGSGSANSGSLPKKSDSLKSR